MSLDIIFFKKQLEEEKQKLEGELGTVAKRNPDQPKDWNTTYPDMNIMAADKEEVADQEEEYENRASFELELESRLRDINDAMVRVETGKFGKCIVGGEDIDEARLRANPAAATCVKHAQ